MKLSFEQILRLIVIIIEALLRMTDDERHEVALSLIHI